MRMEPLNDGCVSACSFLKPLGNAGNGGGAEAGFLLDVGVRKFLGEHGRCLEAF